MNKKRAPCKYCGRMMCLSDGICTTCRDKLELIRIMLAMVKKEELPKVQNGSTPCKYCGCMARLQGGICAVCGDRLVLVRTILAMVKAAPPIHNKIKGE